MPAETAQEKPTFDQAAESARASIAEADKAVAAPDKGETKTDVETKSEEQPTVETPKEEATETQDELLTKEEVSKLSASDAATYRKMQKAYTQKTQKLAEDRKKLESRQQIIDAFDADPKGTISRLAQQHGLKLAEEPPVEAKPEPTVVSKATSKMEEKLVALLGEDNKDLASGLAKIFEEGALDVAKSAVNAEVKPIKDHQEAALAEAAKTSTESDLKAMDIRHPDWKQHEPKMLEIGRKWTPSAEITSEEYLDTLYALATRDLTETEQTRKVVERINKSVARAEPPDAAVNTNNVTPARPKHPTLDEAFEAAKRGVVWS